MSAAVHELWHIGVLTFALFGAASAAILTLAPLVFDRPPEGLARWRPMMIAAIVLAVGFVAGEWLIVH
jgi:hypothetical protein